ncbi:MAG: PQQ-dependent sugar dehydrogenase [bacterium]
MQSKSLIYIILVIVIILVGLYIFFPPGYLTGLLPAPFDLEKNLEKIKLPKGFKIEIYARDAENARSMCLGPEGVLFVGSRKAGNVYAIPDRNHDNKADKVITLFKDLDTPNGIAYRNGSLYVSEISRILRWDHINDSLENPGKPVVVNDSLPSDTWHGWRVIRFGPRGKLYISIGAPCNVCLREDKRYATIMRMDADGSGLEIFAEGIRNSVGFDWDPENHQLWFTDNGRDWMGDDKPPDELNHASSKGMHFGFPYCHGKDIEDPEYNDSPCSEFTSPELDLGPHVAALGMRFYTGDMFPERYRGGIFIAEHGSWNRSIPIGYRIMFVRMVNNSPVSYEIFAEGWLEESLAWGRPVDVHVMPDGAILVSDDKAGAIYRISYE